MSLALELVSVPGGSYRFGSTQAEIDECVQYWQPRIHQSVTSEAKHFASWIAKESPTHVRLLKPFSISKTPVHNALFQRFITEKRLDWVNPAVADETHPAYGFTQRLAELFCRWYSDQSGQRVRLPSEFEWEVAARGPDRLQFPFGNVFDPTLCNTAESGIGNTTPVDAYPQGASPFGVLDMAGNVEEMTSSNYMPYPGGAEVRDDLWYSNNGKYKIYRGGFFDRTGDLARGARRHGPVSLLGYHYVGFRLVSDRL